KKAKRTVSSALSLLARLSGVAPNVVRNLASLGAEVFALGIVDTGDAGNKVHALLREIPHVTRCLHTSDTWSTPHKTRYSSQGQQLLRFDQEKTCAVDTSTEEIILDHFEDLLPKVDVVILSDYAKGTFASSDFCQSIIKKAVFHKKPVVVDPKGYDYTKYKGATLLTPNFIELQATTQIPLKTHKAIAAAAHDLKTKCGVESMIVTLGANGIIVVETNHDALHIPAQAKDVFDVSGAGDTVIATLAYSLSQGASLRDAATLANKAGGIVVGKVGTAVIHHNELFEAIDGHEKIFTLDNLMDQVQRWRRQNLTVGFTNGCFDLLHLGHLHLINQCKAQCDRLIVGLNTDSSIKTLKGPMRPIQNEQVRSHVLSALEAVDAVILFSDETPLQLITTILPDVLIKGADYTVDTVVGGDVVMKNGGRVYLAELKEGQSTTNTVARIKVAG
ncbi:MAG: D-glycero-beta-D-manno-heptose 1-phosphate adenylyltransferase, partial [Alphaproteobacteria bacterium]|nr:D-glycero-beta-D-manno-heptose 1-phosphate adenylyltransferase [Alphaproteobacteria bacterium]